MKKLIGKFATNNYLIMRLELLLRMDPPNPCRMSWRIIKKTIVPWLTKIGVITCPQSRSKIIGKNHETKSIIFHLI